MNTFTAHKIGEVHAFQKSALEQFDRGSETLQSIHGDQFEKIRSQFELFIEGIEQAARENDVLEAVTTKSEKTQEKLRSMRDIYLVSEEDWSEPAEIMEWSSFFHGAAYAHVELVCGAAQTLENDQLLALCRDISKLHHDLLDNAVQFLKETGSRNALEEE